MGTIHDTNFTFNKESNIKVGELITMSTFFKKENNDSASETINAFYAGSRPSLEGWINTLISLRKVSEDTSLDTKIKDIAFKIKEYATNELIKY